MQKKKLLLTLGLASIAGMVLAGCGNDGSSNYTLREFLSGSPTNWNPHAWEMNTDTYITGYTEMGLVDMSYNPESADGGYKWVYEMADSINDVTLEDEYQTDDFMTKWGIADDDTGRVWQINLNQGAKWQDGTAINADTYVDSMKEFLDPHMKNYRANTYCSGDSAIAGANSYFLSDAENYISCADVEASLETEGVVVRNDTVVLNWETCAFWAALGSSYSAFYNGNYSGYFVDTAGTHFMTKYPNGTVMTDAIREELSTWSGTFLTSAIPASSIDTYFGSELLYFPAASFDTVGIVKTGDYSFNYITANAIDEFNFLVSLTSNWIVKKDIYDAGKDTTGSLVTTTYGTTLDTYMGFGPYKLTSFQKDKQMKFERNDQWYGWKDGKHEGQYQTTNIVCDIIAEHSTAMLAFEQGNLDSIDLENADMTKYAYSDYLLHTPETYTERMVFDSNVESLKKLETAAGDGKNKQILSNYSFRKALSLCVDRARWNSEGALGHSSSYGLLNTLYYYDVANDPNSIYRNTPQAKQAICDLYGIEYGEGKTYATLDEAYAAITGFDLATAKSLFQQAYTEAIASGNYTAGQSIQLNWGVYDATDSSAIAKNSLLNEFVAAATKGTNLEGKINFTAKSYNGDTSRYDAIGAGAIEMADCAWGGAAFYPFSSLECYTNTDEYSVNEIDSFDPKAVNYSITYDWDGEGTGVASAKEYSFFDWVAKLNSATDTDCGVAAVGGMEARLYVMSRLEYGLLNRYDYAILGSYGAVSLFSKKINYATTTYNIMYGYGGIRYTTYNYNDGAWASYVKSQGGTVNYK